MTVKIEGIWTDRIDHEERITKPQQNTTQQNAMHI